MVASSYEEIRLQRLEENKKRMGELNLLQLSKSLSVAKLKPSPGKQMKSKSARKPLELTAVRRSTRVADKPQPDYREGQIEPLGTTGRRLPYRRRDLLNRKYASHDARVAAVERAEMLEVELGSEFPTFVKPMLQSHVTGGFWLGLPHRFCITHMPKEDEMFTLEDEDGIESLSKYLGKKNGLSGGWRGFAIDHELVDGDALVFQLVKPTKFKVYIIRVNDLEYGDDEDEDSDEDSVGDDDSEEDNVAGMRKSEPEEVTESSTVKRRSIRKKSNKNGDEDNLKSVPETDSEEIDEASAAKRGSLRRKSSTSK